MKNNRIKLIAAVSAGLLFWLAAGGKSRAGELFDNTPGLNFAPAGGADYPSVLYDPYSLQGHGHGCL